MTLDARGVTAAPGPEAASRPQVSVVIPTYRRPALLLRCLEGVAAQRLPASAYEVLIVDDGHDDATRQAVQLWQRTNPRGPAVRYLRPTTGRGPAVARNVGWRAADAPLVAFTDDDTVPQPGWLAEGVAAMARHAEWSGLCGRVEVPLAPPTPRRPTDHELMTQGLEGAEFVTANAFVRRQALERIGGFDEQFTRAWREDSDLQFRLMKDAGPVGRCAEAVVLHPARAEPWGVCLRQQKNAFFEALLYKKHPALYRERIDAGPPWHYYGIVTLIAAAAGSAFAGRHHGAAFLLGLATALVLRFALRRLARTSLAPAHVVEMLATSAIIPFLSVYWRLRGAWRFRVPFL